MISTPVTSSPRALLTSSGTNDISIVETRVSVVIDIAETERQLDRFRPPFDSGAFATLLSGAHDELVAAATRPVSRAEWWHALLTDGLPVNVRSNRFRAVMTALARSVHECLADTFCRQSGAEQKYEMRRRDGVDASVVNAFTAFENRCIAGEPELVPYLKDLKYFVEDIARGRALPCELQSDTAALLGRQIIPLVSTGA